MNTQLLGEFDKATSELMQLITAFDEKQFNTVPFEGSWTAGQLAEHLRKSYEAKKTLQHPVKAADRKPDTFIEPIKKDFLNFTNKFNSPAFIVPEKKNYNKEVLLAQISQSREQIMEAIKTLDLLEGTSFVLPGCGELTRLELIYFMVFHTQRHIHQLKNIYQTVLKLTSGEPVK